MSEHVKVKITEGIRKGDIVVADERHGACIKREWIPAVLRALVEQAGGVEVILNPRPGVSIRPVDGGPLIIKDGSKWLLLPLEGSK